MAILSVIFGVVLISGVLVMPIIPVLAVIPVTLGHLARYMIKRTGERGGGVALAGLALGYLHLATLLWLAIGLVNEIAESRP